MSEPQSVIWTTKTRFMVEKQQRFLNQTKNSIEIGQSLVLRISKYVLIIYSVKGMWRMW